MPHTKLRPSFEFTKEKLAQLLELAPEAFADGKISWPVLREALGGMLEGDESDAEHFGLFWPGKRDARRATAMPPQGTLIPVPGEGVDEDTTRNLFIEGDNLEVLKLLQKSYAGRVKMIYIDPPYNTGSDFVYEDDFKEPIETYLRRTGQLGEKGEPLTTNTRADGRFHSKWLSMMYPRLRMARGMLRETGAIFVSVDDTECANLKLLLSELFGDENFVAQMVWQRSKKGDSKLIALTHEYVLVFARNKTAIVEAGGWRRRKPGVDEVLAKYSSLRTELGSRHDKVREAMRAWYKSLDADDVRRAHEHYNWSDDRGLYFADNFAGPDDGRKSRPRYDIPHPVTGEPCKKPSTGWRWEEDRTKAALAETPPRIHFGPDQTTIPCRKSYLAEVDTEPYASVFYRDGRAATLEVEELVGKGVFPFPKTPDVLREFIELTTTDGDIVLDFFAGSGSFAQAVWEQCGVDGLARQFICVQLQEPTEPKSVAAANGYNAITDIAKKRLRGTAKVLRNKRKQKSGEDLGFRVLQLARSHYKRFDDYSGDSVDRLPSWFEQSADPLVDDWTTEGLLTETLLLEGFPLDSVVRAVSSCNKNSVARVTSDHCEHALLVCLDAKVYAETLRVLTLDGKDVFVCLDTALTDEAKVQLADRCQLKTI